jgi:hypothetical protein
MKKHCLKLFGGVKIVFYHLSPFSFYLDIGIGIAIARQIDQIHGVIDVIKIDGLCLAGL